MGNITVGLIIGFGFLALYIWSIVWACRDAERRGKSGCLVGLLVMLLSWPIGLIVWLIFRPEEEIPVEELVAPEAEPIEETVLLLAEKEGVGKVFYYGENDKYELRLEMEFYKESHFMSGEEWEEFINFSGQRQEFFILLKQKYPRLAVLLKEHKMRRDFLKLIEYSYGKSQPPKRE